MVVLNVVFDQGSFVGAHGSGATTNKHLKCWYTVIYLYLCTIKRCTHCHIIFVIACNNQCKHTSMQDTYLQNYSRTVTQKVLDTQVKGNWLKKNSDLGFCINTSLFTVDNWNEDYLGNLADTNIAF